MCEVRTRSVYPFTVRPSSSSFLAISLDKMLLMLALLCLSLHLQTHTTDQRATKKRKKKKNGSSSRALCIREGIKREKDNSHPLRIRLVRLPQRIRRDAPERQKIFF